MPLAWRQGRGATIFRVLKRVWSPLLVLVVIGAGAFTVSRLHGIFGSERRPTYADSRPENNRSFDPKVLTYAVFGPSGTVADISYFDANAEPTFIKGASLPWTLHFDITETASAGSILASLAAY